MTAEEFFLTKDPPGVVTELVRGKVVCMPPPGTSHGKWALRVAADVERFSTEHRLGEVVGEAGFRLAKDPDTVRGVDAAFISYEQLAGRELPESGYLDGAPTLAVEVISPSNTERDVAEKIAEYFGAGAQRVWEVRPRLKLVTVHRRGAEPRTVDRTGILSSDDAGFAVEGFSLPVAAIFR